MNGTPSNAAPARVRSILAKHYTTPTSFNTELNNNGPDELP